MAFKSLQQGHYPPPSTQSIVPYRTIHNHAIEPQGMHIGYPTTSLVIPPTYATYNHDLAWQQPQSVPTYGEVPNYPTPPDIQIQLHQSQWQKLTPEEQVLWDKFSPESKKVITTPVPNGDRKPPPPQPKPPPPRPTPATYRPHPRRTNLHDMSAHDLVTQLQQLSVGRDGQQSTVQPQQPTAPTSLLSVQAHQTGATVPPNHEQQVTPPTG